MVVDKPEGYSIPAAAAALADQVLYTGGGAGGSAARNLGVNASTGDLVGFLDDDDEWMPEKLQTQLAMLADAERLDHIVVSSRHLHRDGHTGRTSGALPTRVKQASESVDRYLFWRRRAGGGRASVYTSTLVCSRELALRVGWADLPRHQDWDWLIRAERLGATIVQATEPLVVIQTGSVGSISAGTNWSGSLEWALTALKHDPQVLVDFLAAQTLRYAIAARSARGVIATCRQILLARKLPNFGPCLIALGGVLPRSAIEAMMVRFR